MKKLKPLAAWTVRELQKLPHRTHGQNIRGFDSLVIIPSQRKHDSGFRLIEFVAVKNGVPYIRIGGGSDNLTLKNFEFLLHQADPEKVPRCWSVECLPKSGLLHLWVSSGDAQKIQCSNFDSSVMEIETK